MALMDIGFFSESLGMAVHCMALLPHAREGETLPKRQTLYLLHGYGDSYTSWIRKTNLERYAAHHNLAIIMPDAQKSAYTDMTHGGKFFTYIADELPGKMRAFLPLSERREDTFIAGFSMGGYGAFKIGLARPMQYAAIGCISAGVSNDTPDTVALRELRTGGRPLKDTEEDVPASIARAAALGKDAPRIYHTIGQEDSLLSSARETRDLLCSYPGDPFHYIYEEKPGKHGWEFCDGALRDFLQWLSPAPR